MSISVWALIKVSNVYSVVLILNAHHAYKVKKVNMPNCQIETTFSDEEIRKR